MNYSYPPENPLRYTEVQKADPGHVPTCYDTFYGYALVAYATDYIYQCIIGVDSFPDLCIGRWCVEDTTDLRVYVEKAFAYERDIDLSWNSDKALLVAHHQCEGENQFRACKVYIDTAILTFETDTLYGINPGVGNDDIMTAFTENGGVGVVNYTGHGSQCKWCKWTWPDLSYFTTDHIFSLDQSSFDGYPIVYNICCLNGCIPYTEDGISETKVMAEAWTRNDTGGGVAALSASGVSTNKCNHVLDTMLFTGHFDQSLNCGMAINGDKVEMINAYPVYSLGLENAYMYYWIGDPELDVWRGQPQAAVLTPGYYVIDSPNDTTYVGIHVYLNDGNMTPVPGAKVCVHKYPEYHAYAYTFSDGAAWFPWPIPDGASVVATKQTADTCIIPAIDTWPLMGGGA